MAQKKEEKIAELISKHDIQVRGEDKLLIRNAPKPKDIEYIKKNKEDFLAALKGVSNEDQIN